MNEIESVQALLLVLFVYFPIMTIIHELLKRGV